MRVTIERGFHASIQQLMGQLKTDDPKLAINHIIGCWLASNGCPGRAIAVSSPSAPVLSSSPDDEFADIIEF